LRLTNFTDYGLRMLMLLAAEPARDRSSVDLAQELGLSRNHLAKIIQHLSHAGLVETRRGSSGGLRLAHAPKDMRLGSLVAVLEQGQALVSCLADPQDATCTLFGQCRLKARLRSAEAAFLAELDRSSLADIALGLPAQPLRRAAKTEERPVV
jgi:Rrf2 family nitric oxide-sensitive transcriptional repressor